MQSNAIEDLRYCESFRKKLTNTAILEIRKLFEVYNSERASNDIKLEMVDAVFGVIHCYVCGVIPHGDPYRNLMEHNQRMHDESPYGEE